jgi:prepilin-type N-terminal cleavage/methylation domain-containing protein
MNGRLKKESGMTLIESMMAITILLVGLLGMAQVLALSLMASKTHGRDAGKATAHARQKMEELVALDFSDTTTNITIEPPYASNGTGLTAGGSVYPDDPVEGYTDSLGLHGMRVDWGDPYYVRQWQIIDDGANPNLKTIIVSVRSAKSFEYGTAPSTKLITQKTQ